MTRIVSVAERKGSGVGEKRKEEFLGKSDDVVAHLPKRPQRVWTASNDASDVGFDDKIVGWAIARCRGELNVDELSNEGKFAGVRTQPAALLVHSRIQIRMRRDIS